MYVCVLPLTSTHFLSLHIINFPFFTPFCNRQMKVKKECIEYIRCFKDDEAKRHQESSTTFYLFLLFLFSICLSFSPFLLLLHDSTRLSYIVSKQKQQQVFVRLQLYCVVPLLVHNA